MNTLGKLQLKGIRIGTDRFGNKKAALFVELLF
jgi:hypothetical protein